MRTHYCGLVSEELVGESVTLAGWVHRRRDHGGVIFIDLRDREGLVQVVINPESPDFAEAETIRNECVVQIEGEVVLRPDDMINPNIVSGKIEVVANRCKILNRAEALPFQLGDDTTSEEVR